MASYYDSHPLIAGDVQLIRTWDRDTRLEGPAMVLSYSSPSSPDPRASEFELALEIHPDDDADQTLLTKNGWRVADPAITVGDPIDYRRYIAGSKAELMTGTGMYVNTHGGWISDRTICYLAAASRCSRRTRG